MGYSINALIGMFYLCKIGKVQYPMRFDCKSLTSPSLNNPFESRKQLPLLKPFFDC